MSQPSFFDKTQEDLPLFSGTTPRGKVKPFAPKPKPKQDAIPVSCTACMDTGNIGGKSCWCIANLETKDEAMINYQETDLNHQLAHDAHRGTSFTPEVRADQEIAGYIAEMEAVSARFAPFATEENERALRYDLEQYRRGYLKRLEARLAAKSRCISTMIAGPSGFNQRRNEKANDTEHRRSVELLEWRKKALNRLDLNYNPVAIGRRPIRSDEADAIQQLQTKIEAAEKDQAMMKETNKIIRSKKFSDAEAAAKIDALELSEELLIYFMRAGEGKFPSYRLTNNNANIKRMKGRVKQLEAEAGRLEVEDREATIEGTRATIIENRDEGRLQLRFDGKPPAGVIKTLKTNGFKWSRTNEAWQRLLNDNSRRTVETLTI